jgi:hypothetical protein
LPGFGEWDLLAEGGEALAGDGADVEDADEVPPGGLDVVGEVGALVAVDGVLFGGEGSEGFGGLGVGELVEVAVHWGSATPTLHTRRGQVWAAR